jgi:hypothetical protein
MKRRYQLLIIFLILMIIGVYGSWADSDEYMMLHNYDKPYREAPWSDPAEFIAGPGFIVALLVFNRTDIPERDPDSWQTAWLIAPSAATIWIGLFLMASKAISLMWQYLRSKLRN